MPPGNIMRYPPVCFWHFIFLSGPASVNNKNKDVVAHHSLSGLDAFSLEYCDTIGLLYVQ